AWSRARRGDQLCERVLRDHTCRQAAPCAAPGGGRRSCRSRLRAEPMGSRDAGGRRLRHAKALRSVSHRGRSMMESGAVSVVVPVYESAETLETLVDRIGAVLRDRPWEIILVNDGSSDSSWAI